MDMEFTVIDGQFFTIYNVTSDARRRRVQWIVGRIDRYSWSQVEVAFCHKKEMGFIKLTGNAQRHLVSGNRASIDTLKKYGVRLRDL